MRHGEIPYICLGLEKFGGHEAGDVISLVGRKG